MGEREAEDYGMKGNRMDRWMYGRVAG